ncbi:hypothetical protein [Vibrio pelagius]|uniref:hypothetical protein n=1 Tax=Vibrio pelagius TaxID=28169 RepID=UPI0021C2818C|nr:hypothetical protein [Vibrio pelagius]
MNSIRVGAIMISLLTTACANMTWENQVWYSKHPNDTLFAIDGHYFFVNADTCNNVQLIDANTIKCYKDQEPNITQEEITGFALKSVKDMVGEDGRLSQEEWDRNTAKINQSFTQLLKTNELFNNINSLTTDSVGNYESQLSMYGAKRAAYYQRTGRIALPNVPLPKM